MTARSVETIFTARVDGYLASVARMRTATTDMARTGASSMEANAGAWNKAAGAAAIGGAAIGGVLAMSAKAYMEFEASMSGVGAVANATAKEQKALGEAAIKAGQDTVFSAMQAADAEAELLRAGVSVSDVLGGALTGSLDLAAAGQIGLAESAEIAAQAMNIFNLEGEDVGHIADVLTAGANKSAAGVDDLGMALAQGGLVAKQTGLTLEETVGTLSAFADNSLKGSDAGTSLKTMLQRLNPTSAEAANLMDELGLRAYDSQGNFVGLAEYAGMLQDAMSDMTPEMRNAAMATLFGSDAVRGANVLYEQGEAGMRKYIAAVDDQGAAARMAARQTDNLKGDIDSLMGTLESAFINAGSGGNEGLRSLVQTLQGLVDKFNQLSPSAQATVVKIAAVTAGALLLAAGGIKATTSILAMRASMEAAGLSGGKLTRSLKAAAAAAVVIGGVTIAGNAMQDMWLGLSGANDDATRSLEAYIKGGRNAAEVTDLMGYGLSSLDDVVNQAMNKGFLNNVGEFFAELGTLGGVFGPTRRDEAKSFFAELDKGLTGLQKTDPAAAAAKFKELATEFQAQGYSLDQVREMLPGYSAALDAASVSADGAGSAASDLSDQTYGAAQAARDAADGTATWAEELDQINSPILNARDAARQFEAAIDDASAALKENGKTLDITSEKGRANQEALDGIASAALANITAMQANGSSQRQMQATLNTSRDKLAAVAEKFGMSKTEARKYAEQVLKTPAAVSTTITAKTEAAKAQVAAFQSQINRLRGNTVTITTRYVTVGKPGGGRRTAGGLVADADGGMHVRSGGSAPLVKAYADGGLAFDGAFTGAQPRIAKAGGRGILWAEEGAGPWEAFISGHPAKKVRSRGIAEDTVDRLGGAITWVKPMADGGTMTRSLADQVRGLAPRAAGSGGVTVVNRFDVRIDGALDPVAVGAQVERVLQDYTSVTGRPLQVMTR